MGVSRKGALSEDILPLYALPLIFPYGSYIGTLATAVWIGNSLEKLKNLRGDHISPGRGSPNPRFPDSDQSHRCGPGQCWRQKWQALRNRRRCRRPYPSRPCPPRAPAPQKPPQPYPRKDKSTALRATHSPATTRKGDIPRERVRGACEMFKSPQEGPASRLYFAHKIFGPAPYQGGSAATSP